MYERNKISIEKIANGFLVTLPDKGRGFTEVNSPEFFEMQAEQYKKVFNKDEVLQKAKKQQEQAKKERFSLDPLDNVHYFSSEKEMFAFISLQLEESNYSLAG